ncbi:MAG: hypothetical protein GOV00_02740 [Candidatus Altiarchaeota archaeon]|nr:hypothetical protein [Candidatus Altiarchaeota archaeon]
MEILSEIKNRKSKFLYKDTPIEKEKIELLIEAARWAPSCFNNQPWNYVLIDKDASSREAVEASLSLGNGWAKGAPLLVAVGGRTKDGCESQGIEYLLYDIGLSVMSMVIQAEHLGLGSRQMAGWNSEKLKSAVGFPHDFKPIVLVAFGYPAKPENLKEKITDRLKEKLVRARTRKAPEKNFFFDKYSE